LIVVVGITALIIGVNIGLGAKKAAKMVWNFITGK